jgi:hypothetical protein
MVAVGSTSSVMPGEGPDPLLISLVRQKEVNVGAVSGITRNGDPVPHDSPP